MPTPQLRNSIAADRQQPTDRRAAELRRLRAAQNELARLAWERGPVVEDEDTDNGAARMAAAVREEG